MANGAVVLLGLVALTAAMVAVSIHKIEEGELVRDINSKLCGMKGAALTNCYLVAKATLAAD